MNPVTTSLVLLLAVVVSGPLARALPFAPLPLLQIALGAAIAVVADLGVTLRPELFFLLFLPPLLFLDGWRIPKDALRGNRRTILALAFGLVVFTVLGLGLFINLILPSIPLSVAFALAAVLSPTDPVAVAAITARLPMPKRLMHILEAEALLNDASGLVCMRLAVAATLSGTFELGDAAFAFAWLTAAGLGTGIAVTLAAMWAKDRVSARVGEEPGTQILFSLLIPFGAFLLAEHVDGSGVLAAAAAGITMARAELRGHVQALTRIRRMVVWDAVGFAANGTVFVVLGEQLPRIAVEGFSFVEENGHGISGWLVAHILAITAALIALRFVWVWIVLRIRRGWQPGSRRVVAVMAFAGVRGAVTLAGILSLPLALPDGSPFPGRELAILLAAGVIIASLIASSVLLPILVRRLHVAADDGAEAERFARLAAAEAALAQLEAQQAGGLAQAEDAAIHAEAVARVATLYRRRIAEHATTGDDLLRLQRFARLDRELRLVALRAERDALYALARARKLSDVAARTLVLEIDLAEAQLLAGGS